MTAETAPLLFDILLSLSWGAIFILLARSCRHCRSIDRKFAFLIIPLIVLSLTLAVERALHAAFILYPDGFPAQLRAFIPVPEIFNLAAAMVLLGVLSRRNLGLDLVDATRSLIDKKRAEDTLHDAIENITEAFVVYDADGRLVICNPSFRNLYSYTEEEARPGVHFSELGKIDVERGNVVAQNMSNEEYLALKAKYRKELTGDFIVHLIDGRIIKTRDRRTSSGDFVSIQEDITDQVRKEQQLRDAKNQADAANHAKSQFLANMSHELRTPLNSIIGFSEIIAEDMIGGIGNPRYREYASYINSSSMHLLELINDILDISRIEADRIKIEDAPLDVYFAVDSVVSLMKPRFAERSIALEIAIPDGFPLLLADGRYIRQILINLLSNSVKFTDDGGKVSVGAHLDGSAICLTVSDNGIGIAEQDIPGVLEPFGQVADSWSRNHEGIGLGLSITRRLAELHGAKMSIHSKPGEGTTVSILFPPDRTCSETSSRRARSAEDSNPTHVTRLQE